MGIEYNPDYLKLAREQAKEKGVSPEFIQGDVIDVDFGKEYDESIIIYHSFEYLGEEVSREMEIKIKIRKIIDKLGTAEELFDFKR